MTKAINEILVDNENKKIVIVSHGAAIKFYLMNFCTLNDEIKLEYKNNILDFSQPSVIKLEFNNYKIVNIKNINI